MSFTKTKQNKKYNVGTKIPLCYLFIVQTRYLFWTIHEGYPPCINPLLHLNKFDICSGPLTQDIPLALIHYYI